MSGGLLSSEEGRSSATPEGFCRLFSRLMWLDPKIGQHPLIQRQECAALLDAPAPATEKAKAFPQDSRDAGIEVQRCHLLVERLIGDGLMRW